RELLVVHRQRAGVGRVASAALTDETRQVHLTGRDQTHGQGPEVDVPGAIGDDLVRAGAGRVRLGDLDLDELVVGSLCSPSRSRRDRLEALVDARRGDLPGTTGLGHHAADAAGQPAAVADAAVRRGDVAGIGPAGGGEAAEGVRRAEIVRR